MLVKLNPIVNFINILLKHFSYQSTLLSFSQITNWLCNFLAIEYWRKSCSSNVDWIFRTNIILAAFSSYTYVEKAAKMTFIQKTARKMLMKLTTGNTKAGILASIPRIKKFNPMQLVRYFIVVFYTQKSKNSTFFIKFFCGREFFNHFTYSLI